MGLVGGACLPSNVYYPRTPDYSLYFWVHVCWSAHSDSSFVYRFMGLDYGLGTMNTTTFFTFIPVPFSSLSLSFISFIISSVSFLPFSGRRHKMTHKDWRVVKPQHNQILHFVFLILEEVHPNVNIPFMPRLAPRPWCHVLSLLTISWFKFMYDILYS